METKHVIVLEINEEHLKQIKYTYYSCIYLTHILYYFNNLSLKLFSIFYFLKYWVHGLLGNVVFEKVSYIKNLKNTEEMMIF
jgi:hypothetical protein